jgi:hypothetical protein
MIDAVARPDLPPDDVLERALVLDGVHNPTAETVAVIQQVLEDLYPGKFTG